MHILYNKLYYTNKDNINIYHIHLRIQNHVVFESRFFLKMMDSALFWHGTYYMVSNKIIKDPDSDPISVRHSCLISQLFFKFSHLLNSQIKRNHDNSDPNPWVSACIHSFLVPDQLQIQIQILNLILINHLKMGFRVIIFGFGGAKY